MSTSPSEFNNIKYFNSLLLLNLSKLKTIRVMDE